MSFLSRSRHVFGLKHISKSQLFAKCFSNTSDLPNTSPAFIPKTYYLKTYGCQMNISDSNIVRSLLNSEGFSEVEHDNADIVLLNTCAVRDHAENKVIQKLRELNKRRKMSGSPHSIIVLGCMSRDLKERLLSVGVDMVLGPSQYRHLTEINGSKKYINIDPCVEHYDEIIADRHLDNKVSSYVPIMRGCNNMCSYCIVPYTRGRESSRKLSSIMDECKSLIDNGYKELILLGQNVNSYHDTSVKMKSMYELSDGFESNYKDVNEVGYRFIDLLEKISDLDEEVRIRFISPHPKDFPNRLIDLIKDRNNICNSLQLPVQSGSSSVLKRMNRGYSRESYINLINVIKEKIPNIYLESDIICGFCGESEEEHKETISLLKYVKYDQVYRYCYSMREHTYAYRHYKELDLSREIKLNRLKEVNLVQNEISLNNGKKMIGKYNLVLVEGNSKRSNKCNIQFMGKCEGNRMCIIHGEKCVIDNSLIKKGDYIIMKVNGVSPQSYYGIPIMKSSLKDSIVKMEELNKSVK